MCVCHWTVQFLSLIHCGAALACCGFGQPVQTGARRRRKACAFTLAAKLDGQKEARTASNWRPRSRSFSGSQPRWPPAATAAAKADNALSSRSDTGLKFGHKPLISSCCFVLGLADCHCEHMQNMCKKPEIPQTSFRFLMRMYIQLHTHTYVCIYVYNYITKICGLIWQKKKKVYYLNMLHVISYKR